MPIAFTKMHGLRNDYIYVSLFDQRVADAPALARAISDRHAGVGSDGLILIAPPESGAADVRMIMYNSDGSRSQMCGNGVRCVAKYTYEHGLSRANPMRVQTDAGVLTLELEVESGVVRRVRVDMGEPRLNPREIPVGLEGAQIVNQALPPAKADSGMSSAAFETPDGSPLRPLPGELRMTCVSTGNPHAVFFVPDIERVPLRDWGPQIERHPVFPERVNAHFVQVVRRDYVVMVTWERGAGPTQACGTGASAVCVAGVLNGLTDRRITARLPGGEMLLEWDDRTNHIFKTGPAVEIFSGTWPT